MHAVPPWATATSRSVEADACRRTFRESFHRHHWFSTPFFKTSRLLLTVMNHFTKWAEAIPLRNHTVPTVARTLMVNVFSRFGVPLRLLSDRGSEFESALFSKLCKWMCINNIRTTAYRPSTNGMVERYHRTLNSILGKIIREDQRNWCEKVPIAAAAYRASVHEATGYSPNRLMLNREV